MKDERGEGGVEDMREDGVEIQGSVALKAYKEPVPSPMP